jgi:hypothetical protein
LCYFDDRIRHQAAGKKFDHRQLLASRSNVAEHVQMPKTVNDKAIDTAVGVHDGISNKLPADIATRSGKIQVRPMRLVSWSLELASGQHI